MNDEIPEFSPLQQKLLNDFQRNLPLSPTPFADMANSLGVDEDTVLNSLQHLQANRAISRIGPVFKPDKVGMSTLAAMAVPEAHIDEIARIINTYPEVNHNYEREHAFNLWFVINARDQSHLQAVMADMEEQSGYAVMSLPMLQDYYIDLGFELQWT